MGPTGLLGRSCRQRRRRRDYTAMHILYAARCSSLTRLQQGLFSTGQTPPQGNRSQGERPGHGTPLSPRALVALSQGWAPACWVRLHDAAGGKVAGKHSPSSGYLDAVLQAVAHRRANLLVVAEQSG